MNLFLDIAQLVVSFLLIGAILLQQKGAGIGAAFGGSESIATTRRGPEKTIFLITIILSAAFIGLALARMFVS